MLIDKINSKVKESEAKLEEATIALQRIKAEKNQIELRLTEKINLLFTMQKEFDDYKADFAGNLQEKELELSRFAEEIK